MAAVLQYQLRRAGRRVSVKLSSTFNSGGGYLIAPHQVACYASWQIAVADRSRSFMRHSGFQPNILPSEDPLHPTNVEALVVEVDRLLDESRMHWSQGEHDQCAEKCQRVAQELLGTGCPKELRDAHSHRLSSAHINAACALKALQRYEDALSEAEDGLKWLSRRYSKNKHEVAQVRDLLAELCLRCGREDEADQHITRSLHIKENFPWQKEALAATWNLQAQAHVQRGNLEDAKAAFRKALRAHMGVTGTELGHLSADSAVALSNYAGLVRQQEQYCEAAKIYEAVIEVFESRLGADSELVGQTLVELGAMYVEAKINGAQAAEALTRALVILSTCMGSDHPSVAATMEWLARCHRTNFERDVSLPVGCPVKRLLETAD